MECPGTANNSEGELMFSQFQIFLTICIFIFGLLLGGGAVHSCEQGRAPRTDSTTAVMVKPAPTIHDTIYRDSIRVRTVVVQTVRVVRDTASGALQRVLVADSAVCYSVCRDTAGNHVEADFCSAVFPRERPADLRADILFRAAPCSSRTVTLKTTVVKPGPLFSDWRFWAGCVAMLAVGGYVGHTLR
jgi:hypothetical protein